MHFKEHKPTLFLRRLLFYLTRLSERQQQTYTLQERAELFDEKVGRLANDQGWWSSNSMNVESRDGNEIVFGLASGNIVPATFSSKLVIHVVSLNDGTTKLEGSYKARLKLIILHYGLILFGLFLVIRSAFFEKSLQHLLTGIGLVIAVPICTYWFQTMSRARLREEFELFIKPQKKKAI